MAYERLDLVTGEQLSEDVFKHLEDGIESGCSVSERMFNDLYDKKKTEEYSVIYKTVNNITSPEYKKFWNYAEFSGWWGYCGNPQNFNRVRFPIQGRSGYNLTSITVKIIEMPDIDKITQSTWGVSPSPSNWVVLSQKTINFQEPLNDSHVSIITVDFENNIENPDGKHLFLAVLGNARCSMGYCLINHNDIPYNPWIYYAVDGKQGCGGLSGAGETFDINSKNVYTMVAEFSCKTSELYYTELGVNKKDKFFNLVNDCINNSDSFGEIFDEVYETQHLCGSQNFKLNTGGTAHSTTTTFTGIIFPIGVLPDSISSSGCQFRIKARKSDSGDTTPITKVWAWLYSVEDIPYTQTSPYQFSTLNPELLRTGEVSCNIAVDTEGIVTIQWNEGEFWNIDKKFLMLGYNCNSLNNRCFNADKKSGAQVCSSIDGNTYSTNLETWYSTQKTATASWAPRWVDSPYANAWSLVGLEKKFTLGKKFEDMLNTALDEVLSDYDFDNTPPPTSEVRLAKQYDLVVGDTFQLFFDGVVKAVDFKNENIAVRCSKGKTYMRYWEYTPKIGEEGTYTLTIYTRRFDGSIISQGTTSIVVHKQLTEDDNPSNLTALIFGDSLTSSGTWAAEGFRRIYGSTNSNASGPKSIGLTNNLVTYGTKYNTVNTFPIYHEGYGGWTWSSFLSAGNSSTLTNNGIIITLLVPHNYDLNTVQKSVWVDNNGLLWQLEDFPSQTQIKFNRGEGNNNTQSNTATPTNLTCSALGLTIDVANATWESANPFYDASTQSVSFINHAKKYNVSSPDIVSCLLTWNGGGGDVEFNHSTQITNHINKSNELLKLLHTDFPLAKIIVMGIQLPSITGGNGHNEGASSFYSDTPNIVDYAFEYNKALENLILTDSELKQYCYYVDTKGQFDTLYNMPYSNNAVNTRNTTTEMRGTNGVHPSTAGYYQIGDAFYRALTKVIPIVKEIKENNN